MFGEDVTAGVELSTFNRTRLELKQKGKRLSAEGDVETFNRTRLELKQ